MTVMQCTAFASTAALHVFLGRRLGPADYGVAGIIISAITVMRAGVLGALMMGAAKVIAANPNGFGSCVATAKKAFALVVLVFVLAILLFAPQIASLYNDPSLKPYFLLLPVCIPPLAAFVFLLSVLTGLKDFKSTMQLGVVYQLLKLALVIGFVLAGTRAYGLIFGFGLAAMLSYLFFRRRPNRDHGEEHITLRYYASTVVGIFFALTLAMLLRYVNFWNLKRIILDPVVVGHYVAAAQLSLIPALIFSGFVVALWPAISGLSGESDLSRAREHLSKSFKYLLITLLPFTAVVAALPRLALRAAFGSEYLPGAGPLPILLVAIAILATQSLIMSACLAIGKVKATIGTLAGGIVFIVLLGGQLIPRYGMVGGAVTEVVGFTLTGVVFAVLSVRTFGRFAEVDKLVRIVLSSACLFLVVRGFASSGYQVVLIVPAALALFAISLRLLNVVTKAELEQLLEFAKGRFVGPVREFLAP